MAARMNGMDTDEARGFAQGMDKHAQGVGQGFGRLLARFGSLDWKGSDFARAHEDLQACAGQLQTACTSLEDGARSIRCHADAQDAVSS